MTGGLMDKILVDYKIVKRAIFFILFFLWGAWGLSAQVISSVDTILFAGVIFDSGTGEQWGKIRGLSLIKTGILGFVCRKAILFGLLMSGIVLAWLSFRIL